LSWADYAVTRAKFPFQSDADFVIALLVLNGSQIASRFGGVLSAIQVAKNDLAGPGVHFIVYCVRKPARQKAVIPHNACVNASSYSQGIDVRENRIEKVVTTTLSLRFVECAASGKIIEGGCKNPHLQLNLLLGILLLCPNPALVPCLLLEVTDAEVLVGDPLDGLDKMSHDEFRKKWRYSGVVLKRQ
jgi:hypothetical protein